MEKNISDIIQETIECVRYMQARLDYCRQIPSYVVMAQDQICVAMGEGLNGTSFTYKIPQTVIYAQLFPTVEDAERYGADYYLRDGKGNKLENKVLEADKFFASEIEWAKRFIKTLCKQTGEVKWSNNPDNFIGAVAAYNADAYIIENDSEALDFILDLEGKELVSLTSGEDFERVKRKLHMNKGFEVDRVYVVKEPSGQEYAYFCLEKNYR